jgi:serine/threonine-protein kinase SRPK3
MDPFKMSSSHSSLNQVMNDSGMFPFRHSTVHSDGLDTSKLGLSMKDALGIKENIPTIPEDERQQQREKTA